MSIVQEQKIHDVIIVGAGLSGIGMASHLAMQCPNKDYVILERRKAIGGTWDLFKYPGIRSDSDMSTMGYNFKPWTEPAYLADGGSIKAYIEETAKEYNVTDKIQYGVKAITSDWSSEEKLWTVTTINEDTQEQQTWTSRFIVGCTGYYNYDQGFRPEFPEEQSFEGQIIHPQHWPEDLDYSDKKVVVIGSGATAVTLIPAMADKTEHITMLQRSPTYVASVPSVDPAHNFLSKFLSAKTVYKFSRSRNIFIQRALYWASKRYPQAIKKLLLGMAKKQLKGKVDMAHFTPKYNPWDERLCAVPNGDLFTSLRSGKASVVTDHIEKFTPKGILLQSGKELEADIIVSATGLNIQMLGGGEIKVDGKALFTGDLMSYKGVMIEGVPNAAVIFGYSNSSWTLKSDLAQTYICRLMKFMDEHGHQQAVPIDEENCITEHSVFGELTSGYINRAIDRMIKQGSKYPWKVDHNVYKDRKILGEAPIDEPELKFS